MMTIGEFQNRLNKELEGKEFKTWIWYHDIYEAVKKILKELGYDAEKLYYHQYDRKSQSVSIRLGETTLFSIDAKKKKGKYIPCRWGKGSYEWTFGECKVWYDAGKTVAEAWEEMLKNYQAALDRKDEKKRRGVEVMKFIMEKYDMKSYDARYFIKYMADNAYSIERALEGKAE